VEGPIEKYIFHDRFSVKLKKQGNPLILGMFPVFLNAIRLKIECHRKTNYIKSSEKIK